jgi:hypothetical protein
MRQMQCLLPQNTACCDKHAKKGTGIRINKEAKHETGYEPQNED